jgi:nucleoside-diphosphate-sugar epimerase
VRILVLGGTGSIGAPVLREVVQRGHEVIALARSDKSARLIAMLGAAPIGGDIGLPDQWIESLPQVDAVIHMACDFHGSMEATERRLLDCLLPRLAAEPRAPRFIYTGGCWLFGATGDEIATEQSPFRPLPAFAWMVSHVQRVLATRHIDPIIVHPAMVYASAGGVFRRFVNDASRRGRVRVVGSEDVRWPLVHREDIATLYALALERGATGASYIGAAVEGIRIGLIARAIARRFGVLQAPEIISPDEIAAEVGAWARGYAIDQRLSGERARRDLGWQPRHVDPEAEIASMESAA